ncbi:unnamed protein product [Musa hybrid cultivar]
MVVVAAAAATTSCPRTQKKAPNPFPSLRRRDPTSSTRPPLSPSEKGNAAGPKRPRAKEINSRYLAFSSSSASAAKGGSFSSSPASSSSKGASFSSSSCSASTASSSSSSSTATSSPRRFRSPLPASRPSTPAALPKTCMPNRSKSVDRARPGGTATPRAAHNPAALSSVARALRTTTRSLSVSFQGESFSYQSSKIGPTSPSSKNRKPTPERRGPTAPAATPARSCFKLENSRPLDSHHRWPAATSQQFNSLTRSLDCSVGDKDSFLAAVRSLRQSMALNEGARRASFDGGDFSLSVDTDSLSSGSNSGTHESINLPPRGRVTPHGTVAPSRLLPEKGHRLHRLPDPGTQQPSPNLKSVASSKFVPAKKSLVNGLLSSPFVAVYSHHGSVRPSSPGKLSATSPGGMPGVQRVPTSPAKSYSTVLLPGNAPSIFSFASDIKRGKNGESRIEDAHQLRLLYNRYLQWRWVNAQMHDTVLVQKLTAEKYLSNVWMTTTKMHEPIAIKKLKVQTDRQHVKLRSILKAHMSNLEEWSLIDHDHSIALSGTLGALKTSTIRLPVVNGAKVDFQEVRNAVGSAIDVMQAIGTSIYTLLSKVEGRSSIMSELAELATKEQALMDQCKDLLSMVSAMHVKQCSLFGHVIQMSRPSLIQL